MVGKGPSGSIRLWLGGVVSACRDGPLITRFIEQVRRCALGHPLLFCGDGLASYVSSIQKGFRLPCVTGKRGRSPLRPWDNVCIVQVVKQMAAKRVACLARQTGRSRPTSRVGHSGLSACYAQAGTNGCTPVEALLAQTQNTRTAHGTSMERFHGTFRSRLSVLVRRGRSLARQHVTLLGQTARHAGASHVPGGCVYNLCAPHTSLRRVLYLPDNTKRWVPMTPAMQAGITAHIWTVAELLGYLVPLPVCRARQAALGASETAWETLQASPGTHRTVAQMSATTHSTIK